MIGTCSGHPGYGKISAKPKEIWLAANTALEISYKSKQGSEAGILFGSQVESGRLTLMPKGTPDRKFTDLFLDQLRGLKNQLAPDIIDFRRHVIYEFKTVDYANEGLSQLAAYYRIANSIATELGSLPWRRESAVWYPPGTMTLPANHNALVCTEETNHSKIPGLVLYTIWQRI